MMVNPAGQSLSSKQQLIIPKSTTSNQVMPMFVPITMANNVSVLTNHGTMPNERAGQFGSGTTLRIQTQVINLVFVLKIFIL